MPLIIDKLLGVVNKLIIFSNSNKPVKSKFLLIKPKFVYKFNVKLYPPTSFTVLIFIFPVFKPLTKLSIELILKFPVGDNSPENILKAKLLTSFPICPVYVFPILKSDGKLNENKGSFAPFKTKEESI